MVKWRRHISRVRSGLWCTVRYCSFIYHGTGRALPLPGRGAGRCHNRRLNRTRRKRIDPFKWYENPEGLFTLPKGSSHFLFSKSVKARERGRAAVSPHARCERPAEAAPADAARQHGADARRLAAAVHAGGRVDAGGLAVLADRVQAGVDAGGRVWLGTQAAAGSQQAG